MEIQRAAITLLDWQPVPEFTSNPDALAPAFGFLAQPEPQYPPRDLPVWKTLGKVTALAERSISGRNTARYWTIFHPHLPVRVVPQLGFTWPRAEVTFSPFDFHVWIHSLGLVFVLNVEISSRAPVGIDAFRRLLIRLDEGDSFRVACGPLARCRSVRALFRQARPLLLDGMVTTRPKSIRRDWFSDRPYCILTLEDGEFPRRRDDLAAARADCVALQGVIERASLVGGDADNARERWAVEYGRSARIGAVTGWTFLSMNGIATYISGEGESQAGVVKAARTCHHRNLATVLGLYRLAHGYLSAISDQPGVVSDHFVRYAAKIVQWTRREYPTWSTRWLNTRLRDRDRVNELIARYDVAEGTRGRAVFVSYAHEDEEWRRRLRMMLAPAINDGRMIVHDDRELEPSAAWNERLRAWIWNSHAAVLFVSSEFLASDYVLKTELPMLLEARDAGRLKIYWVLIGPAVLRGTPLEHIQSAADIETPWRALSALERDNQLSKLAERVLENR